jgi:hypothetical protein
MTLYPAGSVFSDSLFQDEVAQALAQKQLADNRREEDLRLAEYEYGFTNKANPYSRYAQQQRQQGIDATDFTNQAAASGRLRSGAYKIRQNSLLFGQGAAQDALRSQYDASMLGFKRAGEDTENAYQGALYAAGRGSLDRKVQSDLTAPPEDAPSETPPAVAPTSAPLGFKPQKLKPMVSSTRKRRVTTGIGAWERGTKPRPGLPMLRPGGKKKRR